MITPVFNGERNVLDCLRSVSEQTHNDVEHIIVDGDSTDGTLSIVQGYEHSKTKVLISEPDSGLYDAINKGLRAATGEIVAVLNSDDVYSHSFLLSFISHLFQTNSFDVIYGNVAIFDENLHSMKRYYDSAIFAADKLVYGIMPAHPAMFIKKSVYDSIGQYSTKFVACSDFEYTVRLCAASLSMYLFDRVFVNMRSGGLTNQGLKSLLLVEKEISEICDLYKIPYKKHYCVIRYFYKLFYSLVGLFKFRLIGLNK